MRVVEKVFGDLNLGGDLLEDTRWGQPEEVSMSYVAIDTAMRNYSVADLIEDKWQIDQALKDLRTSADWVAEFDAGLGEIITEDVDCIERAIKSFAKLAAAVTA